MKNNFRKQLQKQKKQAGVALLEMLVVIGILGILAAGVVTLSTTAFNSLDESQALDNLSAVKVKVQKAYKQQGDYAGLSLMNASGAVPSFLGSEDLDNPFGVDLTLNEVTSTKPNGGFIITMPGMSTASCVNVMTALNPESFYYVAVESGVAGVPSNITDGTDALNNIITGGIGALTVADINSKCESGGQTNEATLIVGAY